MKKLLFVFMFALAAACAATPSIEDATLPAPSLEKVAEGVWIHKSYKDIEPWGPILSQGLVVKTEAGIVLVDTAWTNEDTEELLLLIKSETGEYPRNAIVTHAHEDKMGGMDALHRNNIVTQAYVATFNDAQERGLTPPRDWFGTPFAGGTVEMRIEGSDGQFIDLQELLRFVPGPGHTRDNIVIYHADTKVLFGGCLIRPGGSSSLGNTADADVANWADAVRKVAAEFPDAEIIIPSHGPAGGRELLDHTIALAEAAANE